MTKLSPKILTFEEYKAMSADAVSRGFYRNDRRIFLPGIGWHNEWYFRMHHDFLSPHYWRDWSGKRPPIEVVCPDGNIWCIDRRSSNGDGWTVTGEWPNLTCAPSIDCAPMQTGGGPNYYHGYLRDGAFTPDLAGKTWPVPNIRLDS